MFYDLLTLMLIAGSTCKLLMDVQEAELSDWLINRLEKGTAIMHNSWLSVIYVMAGIWPPPETATKYKYNQGGT